MPITAGHLIVGHMTVTDTTDTRPEAGYRAVPLAEVVPLVPLLDVAAVLRMGRTRAYALNSAGRFPVEVLDVGGRYMVRTADLRRYLGLDVTPPGLTA